jgi:hypothetical protein
MAFRTSTCGMHMCRLLTISDACVGALTHKGIYGRQKFNMQAYLRILSWATLLGLMIQYSAVRQSLQGVLQYWLARRVSKRP